MGTELPDGAALLLQQEMREVEAMFHGTYRVLRHIGRGACDTRLAQHLLARPLTDALNRDLQ